MRTAALFKGRQLLAAHIAFAESWCARARGLLGTTELPRGHGLCLVPCRAVHTFFMRYALDLVFLDAEWRVVSVEWDVRPWRMAQGGRRARAVVEVSSGWLAREALTAGDKIDFVFHDGTADESITTPGTDGL